MVVQATSKGESGAMTTQTAPATPTPPDKKPRTFNFPSVFTMLFGVTFAVWLLAFVVPTGACKVGRRQVARFRHGGDSQSPGDRESPPSQLGRVRS